VVRDTGGGWWLKATVERGSRKGLFAENEYRRLVFGQL
jgi:hypothetical protein